jgi:hypothetical protein
MKSQKQMRIWNASWDEGLAVGRHSFVAGSETPTGHTYGIVSTGPYIKNSKINVPQVFRSQTNGFGFASRSWKVTQVVLTLTHPKKNWVTSFETECDESTRIHWNIQCVCSSKISQMMITGKTVMSQAQFICHGCKENSMASLVD